MRTTVTGILIGIAVSWETADYTISQSVVPPNTHSILTSSIPSNPSVRIIVAVILSNRFRVCRLAPMLAKVSELNRPVLFCLYLGGAIDTWRATGATMPPLARSIYRSRGITCEPAMFAIACALRGVRAWLLACACRLSSSLGSASSSVKGYTSAWLSLRWYIADCFDDCYFVTWNRRDYQMPIVWETLMVSSLVSLSFVSIEEILILQY